MHGRIALWILLTCSVLLTGGVTYEVVTTRHPAAAAIQQTPEQSARRVRLVDIGAVVARKIRGSMISRSGIGSVELVDPADWGPAPETGESVWTTFRRLFGNRLALAAFSGLTALAGTFLVFFGMAYRSPARRRRLVRRLLGLASAAGRGRMPKAVAQEVARPEEEELSFGRLRSARAAAVGVSDWQRPQGMRHADGGTAFRIRERRELFADKEQYV